MIFLLTSDWHVDKKAPENRLDDYWRTVKRKVKFISDLGLERKVSLILQAGDMFNTASVPMDVVGWIGSLFAGGVWKRVWSIEGQHDIRFHNLDNKNNPHSLLSDTGVIFNPRLLHDGSTVPSYAIQDNPPIIISGAGWGDDIPEITDSTAFNILITHRMIIKDRRSTVWAGQEDYEMSTKLLRETGYDLILSGDNHQSFIVEQKGRFLFNCGSLMRTTVAQGSHKPFVVIFDTEDPTNYEKVFVPVEPFEDVMDMDKKERNEKRNEKLSLFIEKLQKTETADIDYKSNVWSLMKAVKLSPGTKTIIQTILS